jgi:hypothetical protein
MARRGRPLLGALALAALAASAGCRRSGDDPGRSGDAHAAPSTVTPQQAGGDTAWLRTAPGSSSASRTVAPVGGGRAVAAVAQRRADPPDAVLLLAIDAGGALAWSRTLDSPCGLGVQPLGASPGGQLVMLVRTACAGVVGGLGPEVLAPSGALVELDADGQFLRTLGLPAEVSARGLWDASLGDGGELVLVAGGSAPFVAGLGAGDAGPWRRDVAGAGRVVAAPGHGTVVGVFSAPAALVRLGADGATLWTRALPAGFSLHDLAVLTDGAVVAMGVPSQAFRWGRGGVEGTGGGLALLVVEPDGAPRTAADVPGASVDHPPVLVALPHGRVLVGGFPGCDRLRALTPQLEAVWERPVDGSCSAASRAGAVTAAGQLVLVGDLQGRTDFGSGYAAEPVGTPPDAFVLGVWP